MHDKMIENNTTIKSETNTYHAPRPGRGVYALGVLLCGLTIAGLTNHYGAILWLPSALCIVSYAVGFAMQETIGEAIVIAFFGVILIGVLSQIAPWPMFHVSLVYIWSGLTVSKLQIGIWREMNAAQPTAAASPEHGHGS